MRASGPTFEDVFEHSLQEEIEDEHDHFAHVRTSAASQRFYEASLASQGDCACQHLRSTNRPRRNIERHIYIYIYIYIYVNRSVFPVGLRSVSGRDRNRNPPAAEVVWLLGDDESNNHDHPCEDFIHC